MINYTIRFAKRFAVLLPGIAISYFAASTLYPIFDKRLSAVIALFLTYVATAYVLIPFALRLFRLFIPARHLPLYCVTPDGFASDPLNIGIIGTKEELRAAMRQAGWFIADKHSLDNMLRVILCAIFKRPYPNAPMSSLYLFGRKQDIGFELQSAAKLGHRHHVRFWATTFDSDKPLSVSAIHWSPRRKLHNDETLLWLGAASRDIGLAFIRHNAQLTHMIHPDTNRERELIAEQLSKQGATQTSIRLRKPYRLANRALRGYLQTDGIMRICKLR